LALPAPAAELFSVDWEIPVPSARIDVDRPL
jgi:hypothetical protein